jgi:hypothetical protein
MGMKSSLAEVVDGRLVLPADAVALLSADSTFRVIIDSDRGTVCIFAKDPFSLAPQTETLMDALAELREGLHPDDYAAPVSEEALREIKRKRQEGAGGE